MIFRPKGRDDCCCKSWKDKINELWEKYQGVVKGVKAGSVTAYPDGDGIADLDGAVADAIAQQVPPMLTDLVTESELSTALEDYPTETELSQTLEDYATQQDLETKQDVLVSGETIRTINGRDLLGEGNLQFNDILPDFSQAEEGDALVIGSEGLPEWGEVDPLPDTEEASTGDALLLDENKLPIWGALDKATTILWYENGNYIMNGETIAATTFKANAEAGMYDLSKMAIVSKPYTSPGFAIGRPFLNSANRLRIKLWGVSFPGGDRIVVSSDHEDNFSTSGMPYSIGSGTTVYGVPQGPSSSQIPNTGMQLEWYKTPSGASAHWRSILPPYTTTDAGKVLAINANGDGLEWITLP